MTVSADPRASRERLVAAVLAVLDAEGYEALRVADVARRAGLTTGAIYSTFRTKHAMVAAALGRRHPAALADAVRLAERADPEVLAAARATLDQRGYSRTRVDQVARQAGVPTAALRRQFPTKHHLLAAAIVASAPEDYAQAIAEISGAGDDRSAATATDTTTRDRLLDAALEVVDAAGYRGARLVDVARKAGMTTGAVYAHFGSKHELLDAAMAKRYGDLYRSAVTPTADQGVEALLASLVAALRQDAAVDHRALVELFALASRDTAVAEPLVQELTRRHEDIAAIVDANKASGAVGPEVSSDGLAHLVQLLALGNIVARAIGAEHPTTDDLEATLQHLPGGSG